MKIRHLLIAWALSLSTTFASQVLFEEFFESGEINEQRWSVFGDVSVVEGKLKMVVSGEEKEVMDAGLRRSASIKELDFQRQPVEIRLFGISLEGSAPPEKRAFVVLLASDQPVESDASTYLRLCLDGNGLLTLAASADEPGDARKQETLASTPVTFPLSGIRLRLTPEGYQLDVEDAAGSRNLKGDWTGKINPELWQGTTPQLVIKALRQPDGGTCEATLDGVTAFVP